MTRDRSDEPLQILLIEDNPGDVRLIRESLEACRVDISLESVTDGERAIEYLKNESMPRPDLVLLDLNLPKVNGETVLETVNNDASLRPVPVVVLSSSESPDDIRETYELGATGYFVKPVDPDEYLSLGRKIVEPLADSAVPPPGEYSDLD